MMNTEPITPETPQPHPPKKYDEYAVLSLSFSIGALVVLPFSLICCIFSIFSPLACITAIVLGFMSLNRISESEGTVRGKEMALAGIIISSIILLLTIALILLALIFGFIADCTRTTSFTAFAFHLNG